MKLLPILLAFLLAVAIAPAASQIHSLAAGPRVAEAQPKGRSLVHVGGVGGKVAAVAVSETRAYLGQGGALTILDVVDPAQPAHLGTLELGAPVTAVQVEGDLAYLLTSVYSNGSISAKLMIVDIHTPSVPVLLSSISVTAQRLQVVGKLVYLAGPQGLQIVDASNPTAPVQRGSYGIQVGDVKVVGTLAYLVGEELQILDVSNPDRPALRGKLLVGGQTLDVAAGRAYVGGAGSNSNELAIVDVSHPSAPRQLGRTTIDYPTDLQIVGQTLYVLSPYGLRSIDVVTPSAMRQLGRYTIPGGTSTGMMVAGDLAYLAYGEYGLRVVDVSHPASPAPHGTYAGLGLANDVRVVDGTAYVASGSQLQLLDVANPAHPALLGSHAVLYDNGSLGPLPAQATAVEVQGGRAYISSLFVPTSCCLEGYLDVVDVANPSDLRLLGRLDTFGMSDLKLVGQRAYITGPIRLTPVPALSIVDVADPAQISWVGSYNGEPPQDLSRSGGLAVDVVGNLGFVAAGFQGVKLVDITRPTTPTLRAVFDVDGDARDIQVVGNLAYVADGANGLRVFDLSNPGAPLLRGRYDTPGTALGVRVAGNLAYVADGQAGVQVVDVTSPDFPLLRGSYDTPGQATRIDVAGDLVYVADGDSGLQILRLLPLPQATASISPAGGALETPDGIQLSFGPGSFGSTTAVSYTALLADNLPRIGSLGGFRMFELSAAGANGLPAQPTAPYTITIRYNEAERGPAIETTLALYYWDGQRWVKEPSSTLDLAARTITATPAHLSRWAVLGETLRTFAPLAE